MRLEVLKSDREVSLSESIIPSPTALIKSILRNTQFSLHIYIFSGVVAST